MSSTRNESRRTIPLRRRMAYGFLVLLLACLPVAVLEVVLRCANWQDPQPKAQETRDPWIGFSDDQTLFEPSPDGKRFRIREARLGYFRPASFLATKPETGYRVFVVGGSTVQGRPWETETAFAKWLELGIQASCPERLVEVVNCGGVSYASYRLSRIVDEILDYSPDLVVLCTGHNEFLEERTYPAMKSLPGFVRSLHGWLSHLRAYRWLRSSVLKFRATPEPRSQLAQKVITRLDYENGLSRFRKSDLQQEAVVRHFRFNLRRMIAQVQARGVRLLILCPPANQKDCFPFKPADEWTVDSRSRFDGLTMTQLNSVPRSERTADFFFLRGWKHLEDGNRVEALNDFREAIDRDICPLRMTSSLSRGLLDTVQDGQSVFGRDRLLALNLIDLCQRESADGIIGKELLVDHVHPSIQTHQKMAIWILELLQEHHWIESAANWRDTFESQAARHLQSLDFGYYQRGKDRLDSVLRWSRGRAVDPIRE